MSWQPCKVRRKRRDGLAWKLAALLGLGFLAVLFFRQREGGWPIEEPRDDREPEPWQPRTRRGRGEEVGLDDDLEEPEDVDEDDAQPYDEASPDPGKSLWLAGPAGNLYVRDGGTESLGDRLPVLFVHSLGGNGGQWALQLDHVRRRRRALALDLRGHGESDPAEDGDYSIAGFAGDIAAVADQLDLRHFVLAGHSLGATVAIEYASRHPERVAGLLLADPNGDQTRVPAKQMAPFLEALKADPLREMEWYFRQLVAGGDATAAGWVIEDLRLTHEDALVGGIEGASTYAPLPPLEHYPGPKLSIISDMNSLPFSLHELIPSLPLRLMPGTGHWLQMDRPETFNRLLDDFLAEVDGAAA